MHHLDFRSLPLFVHPSTYSITRPYLCGFPGKLQPETKVLTQYYTWGAIITDVITVTGLTWKKERDSARGVPSLPVSLSSMLSYSWITISSSIINEVKLLVAC